MNIFSKILSGFFNFILEKIAFNDFGLAIFIFTLILRSLFLPVEIISFKSQKKFLKLQEKFKEIQKRYKNDAKLQQEKLADFLAKEKFNPVFHLVPLFLQIFVFVLFYKVLVIQFQTKSAFFLNTVDLKKPNLFLAAFTSFLNYFYSTNQRKNSNSHGSWQNKIPLFLSFILFFIFIQFPAGILLFVFLNILISFFLQKLFFQKI